MRIAKIISGGQTGVDIAALRAAKLAKIPTGGTMPKGFLTLLGPRPEWAREFGLAEHPSPNWPPRTWQNVKDSDITIRIAVDFKTSDELCTRAAILSHKKPSIDLEVVRGGGRFFADEDRIWAVGERLSDLAEDLGRGIIVNFAGNSEKTAPGIELVAEGYIRMIIEASA